MSERALMTATNIRTELNISSNVKINLNFLLSELSIRLRVADLGKNILGACKTKGLNKLIVISDQIISVPQKKFTILHEIGHILIHHGSFYCPKSYFYSWKTTNEKENEANTFAAELLIPQIAVKPLLNKHDISFKIIKSIAKQYEASISATAIKFIENYNDLAVIICHKNNKILWQARAPEFYLKISHAFNHLLESESSIGNFAEGYVEPTIWIDDENISTDINYVKCYEETLYFSKLNTYLSIIKIFINE